MMNKTAVFVILVLLSVSCVKSDDNINRFRDLTRQPRILNDLLLNVQNLVSNVLNVGCTITEFFINIITSVQRFIVDKIIVALLNSIRGVLFEALAPLMDLIINIVNAIDAAIGAIFQGISNLSCGTTNGIASLINSVLRFIINI
ncbi:uncharacterized protein LOC114330522 [Diabrotica virgifera virgifera]|uniref:Uncharacterized protein LOC114330522 n=1 Tax=Diabrotica virgifera virgifera TaxID=50390 RepID=A0A6P7FS94_DIAVI|nr:uncharacterized protein LOC114330522 [Diabrotica virgifera virgifera]